MPTNEAVLMLMRRVVMRPVNNRLFAGVLDDFAAHLHAVADLHRYGERERDVVNHLNFAIRRLHSKLFVRAMRVSSVEKCSACS